MVAYLDLRELDLSFRHVSHDIINRTIPQNVGNLKKKKKSDKLGLGSIKKHRDRNLYPKTELEGKQMAKDWGLGNNQREKKRGGML